MRISQLNLLLALEKYGSFSAAAKELFMSQPYISASVKELENEVGFQILERSNKGVHFTLQGEMVLEKARTIIGEMESIQELRNGAAEKGLAHRLRAIAAPFFCNTIFGDALAALAKDISGFEFDLRHANGGDIVKAFSFEQADVGIVLTAEDNELGFLAEIKKNNLKHAVLYTSSLCHLVRKGHPLCEKDEVTLADIVQYPQVFQYNSFLDYTLSEYRRQGYSGKPIIIENIEALLTYLSVSDAVMAFVEEILTISSYRYRGALTALHSVDYSLPCKVICVYTQEVAAFTENYLLPALKQVSERKTKCDAKDFKA